MPETSRFLRCYRSNNGNTRYSSNGSSLLKTAQTDPLSSPAEKLPQSFYLSQSPSQVLQNGPILKEESEYPLKFNGTRSNSQVISVTVTTFYTRLCVVDCWFKYFISRIILRMFFLHLLTEVNLLHCLTSICLLVRERSFAILKWL